MESPATSLFFSWIRNMMSVRRMGEKMADCGVLPPMTTRQMKNGASVKLKKRPLKDGKCRKQK
uniref:SEL1L adaptor subunit of ERAD E3 ubiquitin ligase n=1 Tax=Myotis myotis TaxID=51298 RepID=A0A7J8ARD4_MYOMY|nr:SEL1L adaptor subunit of ERAD E3 ubiquitin ligase [Myotis myotis]